MQNGVNKLEDFLCCVLEEPVLFSAVKYIRIPLFRSEEKNNCYESF